MNPHLRGGLGCKSVAISFPQTCPVLAFVLRISELLAGVMVEMEEADLGKGLVSSRIGTGLLLPLLSLQHPLPPQCNGYKSCYRNWISSAGAPLVGKSLLATCGRRELETSRGHAVQTVDITSGSLQETKTWSNSKSVKLFSKPTRDPTSP